MDMFGPQWEGHDQKMAAAWDRLVAPGDVVLSPGDLSWAMTLTEAAPDLAWLGQRPGRIVLVKGNHDYFWTSARKTRAALPPNTYLIQNDALDLGEPYVLAGTRLWDAPGREDFTPEDEKVFLREKQRLEMTLAAAQQLAAGRPVIAAVHYPPVLSGGRRTDFAEIMARYGVALCVYGHLHGVSCQHAFEGELDGVRYLLVSSDHLDFTPRRIEL